MTTDNSLIQQMLSEGKAEEALKELETCDDNDASTWYLRGKALWRKGEQSRAMSCYAKAVDIDPESPAATALEQARDIAAFFNPDLLNP